MAAMAIPEVLARGAAPRAGLMPLHRLWQAIIARHARRAMRRRLYGIEPRLLRDMGFDPAEVYDAFSGTPGEVQGDRFRGLGLGAFRGRK